MNEILIMLLVPLGVFSGFGFSESKDKVYENNTKQEYNLSEGYTRSVIYLDIEQAFNAEVYEQKEDNSENVQTIVKK